METLLVPPAVAQSEIAKSIVAGAELEEMLAIDDLALVLGDDEWHVLLRCLATSDDEGIIDSTPVTLKHSASNSA